MGHLYCSRCEAKYDSEDPRWRCDCGSYLDIEFTPSFDPVAISTGPRSLWRYRAAIPIRDDSSIVSLNEGFFRGHWPANPVMPGVLQLEALAQAAGLLLSQYVRSGGKMAALAGLDRVKMRRPVSPGDRLLLDVSVKKIRRTLGVCEGVATVGGEVAAEANLLFGLIRSDSGVATA